MRPALGLLHRSMANAPVSFAPLRGGCADTRSERMARKPRRLAWRILAKNEFSLFVALPCHDRSIADNERTLRRSTEDTPGAIAYAFVNESHHGFHRVEVTQLRAVRCGLLPYRVIDCGDHLFSRDHPVQTLRDEVHGLLGCEQREAFLVGHEANGVHS